MRLRLLIAGLIAPVALAGCASVARGVNEDVVIRYEPADATVTTSLDHKCRASPCTVNVARKKTFEVTATKPGYQSQTVRVGKKVSNKGAAGFAGNVVAGGVVGMGVDAATGAAMDHVPNPVIIKLVPLNATEPSNPAEMQPPESDTPTLPTS